MRAGGQSGTLAAVAHLPRDDAGASVQRAVASVAAGCSKAHLEPCLSRAGPIAPGFSLTRISRRTRRGKGDG